MNSSICDDLALSVILRLDVQVLNGAFVTHAFDNATCRLSMSVSILLSFEMVHALIFDFVNLI